MRRNAERDREILKRWREGGDPRVIAHNFGFSLPRLYQIIAAEKERERTTLTAEIEFAAVHHYLFLGKDDSLKPIVEGCSFAQVMGGLKALTLLRQTRGLPPHFTEEEAENLCQTIALFQVFDTMVGVGKIKNLATDTYGRGPYQAVDDEPQETNPSPQSE